jgi:hypothetical protein
MDSDGELYESGLLVSHLNRALLGGLRDLKTVPKLLKRVIRDELWRDRVDPSSTRRYTFSEFAEFVDAPPPDGLATTEKQLRGLCSEDVEARALLDEVLQRPHGVHDLDNVKVSYPTGNNEAQALRRLRKSRNDLYQRVLLGELSAHKASIIAGFRKPTASLPVDSPENAIRALARRFTTAELRTAVDALESGRSQANGEETT